MITVYLANGVFNAGERLHNLFLAKHLHRLGYRVILPQREALRFFDGERFDLTGIAEDCRSACEDPGVIFVGCLDGADADSGTSVEYALAIAAGGKVVIYRTDIRTAPEQELGVNAMFRIEGTELVIRPCLFTRLEEVKAYYEGLAQAIHERIVKIRGL